MLHSDIAFVSRIPRAATIHEASQLRSSAQRYTGLGGGAGGGGGQIPIPESRSSRSSDWSSWSTAQGAPNYIRPDPRIGQLQSQLIQLEDELAAQRGRILGWQDQQWLIDKALMGARNEDSMMKSQMVAMEFQIATMHKVVTDQSKTIINLQRKMDALATLALLTSMMVCSLIVAWDWTTR